PMIRPSRRRRTWPRPGRSGSTSSCRCRRASRARHGPGGSPATGRSLWRCGWTHPRKEIVVAHVVHIPTPLRAFTGKQDSVEVEGGTVGEVLAALTAKYPELQRHLYNEQGRLRHFVNVYVNDDRSEEHTSELQSRENLVCR